MTHAQHKYRDYLHADSGFSFADWLGIRAPVIDSRITYGKWQYRYSKFVRSTFIAGSWEPTQKAAKASYKAKLTEYHTSMRCLLST